MLVDQLVSRCGPVFGVRLNRVLTCVESPVGLALIDLTDKHKFETFLCSTTEVHTCSKIKGTTSKFLAPEG
jgi:hypothetical protein